MSNYSPDKFIKELNKKIGNRTIVCPYCGGVRFTTTDSLASILLNKDMGTLHIGPTMPCGMIICENCGHIDFFALGVLGMLQRTEKSDGEKEQ